MRSSKSRALDGPSKKKIFVTLGLILIILTSFFGGYFTQFALRGSGEKVVGDVIHIMDQVGYVYDKETDSYVKIEGDRIAKLIADNFLDDYSRYYTKEEYAELQKTSKGDYSGFGITILVDEKKPACGCVDNECTCDCKNDEDNSEKDGTNVIYKVAINSPAFHAGLKDGDKVTSATVEGEPPVTISNAKQLKEFMSSVGESVNVTFTIERAGETKTLSCAKAKYVACYVTYKDSERSAYFAPNPNGKMVTWQDAYDVLVSREETNADITNDDVAYIKLSAFEGDAALQFGAAIEYMVSRGRTKLVLDLCDNGGGSMTVLEDVASYLIYNKGRPNTKVAQADEKLDATDETGYLLEGDRSKIFFSEVNNFKEDKILEISIMANSNTASASECLIGAMISCAERVIENDKHPLLNNGEAFCRDNLVVVDDDGDGEYKTYGKGIMQTTYKLNTGGAIKLTTAKMVWPYKNPETDQYVCIHKKGIEPSVDDNKVDTSADALKRAIALLCD